MHMYTHTCTYIYIYTYITFGSSSWVFPCGGLKLLPPRSFEGEDRGGVFRGVFCSGPQCRGLASPTCSNWQTRKGLKHKTSSPFYFILFLWLEEIRRSPVEVGSLSHYLQGLYNYSRFGRIASINSMMAEKASFSLVQKFLQIPKSCHAQTRSLLQRNSATWLGTCQLKYNIELLKEIYILINK